MNNPVETKPMQCIYISCCTLNL